MTILQKAKRKLMGTALQTARGLRSRWLRGRALTKARDEGDGAAESEDLWNPPADKLRSKPREKVKILAEILGCSEAEASLKILERTLAAMPNIPLKAYLLPTLFIKRCERIGEELVQIELDNGRIFSGHRSNQKEFILHQVLSHHLPDNVDGNAYKLAFDIEKRYYGTHLSWHFPDHGIYVEGGCFTGLRALAWHDLAIQPKRILAVEIGAANAEILRRNISDNGLDGKIIPVHAGLWRESGEGVQKHAFSTRRFLEATDDWKAHMRHEERVRLLTIDDLLNENDVDVADFVNLQVNGAEIEVIKGIRDMDRIKVLSVAAYFSQDGVENADVVENMLTAAGCSVIQRTGIGRVTVATPKYREEVLSWKRRRLRRLTK